MLIHYPAERRGYTRLDWLDSYHSFSFGDFFDAERMGVSVLRVLNDDTVHAGGGFGSHPHRDMEILTYVVSGAIEHRDSLGHAQRINAGECQRMTAGSGIVHSEYNPLAQESAHFLQIWIKPARQNLEPSYEQAEAARRDGLVWLASGDGLPHTLHVHQDVRIGRVRGAGEHALPLAAGRVGFLQVIRGRAELAGQALAPGDGAALIDSSDPRLTLDGQAEALWFDLPGYANPARAQ